MDGIVMVLQKYLKKVEGDPFSCKTGVAAFFWCQLIVSSIACRDGKPFWKSVSD